jgi:hypothetical protein
MVFGILGTGLVRSKMSHALFLTYRANAQVLVMGALSGLVMRQPGELGIQPLHEGAAKSASQGAGLGYTIDFLRSNVVLYFDFCG